MANRERTKSILPNNTNELVAVQEDLLSRANDVLREKVDWVIAWYKNDTKHSLLHRWDLGVQVREIMDDQKENGCKKYGSHAFQTIATFSGEAESSLRVCAKLAKLYKTKGQVVDLAELVMSDGFTPLSFSHIRAILALDNPVTGEEDRLAAIRLTVEGCWTSEQLAKYVRNKTHADGSKNPSGRPVAVPKNLDAVINQQLSFAEDFEKRNVKVWKDPAHSLTGRLASVPAEQYTEELAKQLGVLAHKLRQLAQEASERADESERRFQEVQKVLARRYENATKVLEVLSEKKEVRKDPRIFNVPA